MFSFGVNIIKPELAILKLLCNKTYYDKWSNKLTPSDFPEDLQSIYRCIHLHYQDSNESLQVLDLATIFFSSYSKDKEYYEDVFNTIENYEVKEELVGEYINKLHTNKVLKDISIVSYEVFNGKESIEKLNTLLDKLQNVSDVVEQTESFVTDNLETLITNCVSQPGLRWRLSCLNKSLGSLRKGDFGFIFARPESFSRDTEVLTPSGWVTVDKVTKETYISQVNPDLTTTFVQPEAIHPHEQTHCYHIYDKLGRVDLIVTEGHGMIYEKDGKLWKERADTVKYYQGRKHHVSAATSLVDLVDFLPEHRLAIAYQADGHTRNYKECGYTFSFKKERKQQRLKEILNDCGYEYSEYKDGNRGHKGYYVKSKIRLHKNFDWINLSRVSKEWCQRFIEELSYWDATRRTDTRFKFDTTNRSVADKVQAIAILAGYNCLLSVCIDDRSPDYKDVYSLTIRTNYQPVDGQCIVKERIPFTDTTYCFEVPSGMLLVRRNGAVAVSGNTGKTTFLASEVSNMLTQVDSPILWINNEEQGDKVMLRVYQAFLGVDMPTLYGGIKTHQKTFLEGSKGLLKLYDNATVSKWDVEKLCKQLSPSLIIFDQIDKITGFKADREDLMLGSIYQWGRELAKKYCPIIAVCQADGTGEGVKWLTMSHVANAKCLSPETAVLMYDGSWKAISDIKIGEQVMGPDSTPRNVLNTTTGIEEMFRVRHKIGGDWYDVNKSHLLCLIDQYGKKVVKNVLDYNQFDFGYRVGHELNEKTYTIEPYYLGLWLGDGKASAPEITTMDQEIKDYIRRYSKCWGCDYVEWQNGIDNPLLVQSKIKYKQGVKHPLMEELRKLNLVNNKHIPDIYFKGSIQQRLELLAGLLDTDGTLNKREHEYFTFVNKSYEIAYGVKCLALSCGLMATFKQKGFYYYVHISGNDLSIIPTKVARKQSNWKSYKDVLKSRLEIESLGIGSYAGFVLDGDHQFIIRGNIVTHNTAKQAEADWILGIGMTHDPGWDKIRFLNISKNKLFGDSDSDPTLKHGRFEVLIDPFIARYKDL